MVAHNCMKFLPDFFLEKKREVLHYDEVSEWFKWTQRVGTSYALSGVSRQIVLLVQVENGFEIEKKEISTTETRSECPKV